MASELGVTALALRELGLRNAKDKEIFDRARLAGATLFTKDADFVELLRRRGPPPSVVWLRSGNSSNLRVRQLLQREWPRVESCLLREEGLVEL